MDIKKAIEENLNNNLDRRIRELQEIGCIDNIENAYCHGYIDATDFILSKWEEATRWRKFGTDDLPKIGQQIVCRNGDKYHLSKPISHDGIHWLAEHFKEWQPINP